MIFLDIMFKKSLTIFCYHDVTDTPSEFCRSYELSISPELFNNQINFIRNHFNVLNPCELLDDVILPNSALITFDDGYKSFITNVIPILNKHQVPCLIFLNMGPIKGEVSLHGLTHYLCDKRKDFIPFLKKRIKLPYGRPPFLSCSKSIVNIYLDSIDKSFDKDVAEFVGPFLSIDDLKHASTNPLIYYGNHLFQHDVALLMSEKSLLDSFHKNNAELEKFPNYINFFSFPFGQPESCFSKKQIDLIFNNGAKKIFRSSGTINNNPSISYLDRITLDNKDSDSKKVLFNLFKSQLRTLKRKYFQIS